MVKPFATPALSFTTCYSTPLLLPPAPYLVPHCCAQLHPQLCCHALCCADGGHPAWLRDADGPRPLGEVLAAIPRLQQELRHLGGLTTPRLATEHLQRGEDTGREKGSNHG